MALPAKIYKNDVGTEIKVIIETDEDISGATTLEFEVLRPDGTEATWTAVYSLEGSNKTLTYTTTATTDLSVAGKYKLQPYIEIVSWQGRGNTVTFRVYDHKK